MTDAQIKLMVDRFLGWKLPENFNPDGGISFKKAFNEKTPWPMKNEPTGTNLFDATQAEDMIRYILAEPSTEGTQAAQPQFGFFRCLSCGFNGTISTDEIAKHRAQCSHGPTVPMSQAEWEARGEPAPVAQVDAGKRVCRCGNPACPSPKYDCRCGACMIVDCMCNHVPAVAQTEWPPIPDDLKNIHQLDKKNVVAICEWHAKNQAWVRSPMNLSYLIERIASLTQRLQCAGQRTNCAACGECKPTPFRNDRLGGYVCAGCLENAYEDATQRLQESEAREAELKAEIAKHLEMIAWFNKRCDWYSGELKRHDDRMEALERSHKALLAAIKSVQDAAADICMTYNQEAHNPDCDCYFCVYDRASDAADLVIAAAEKL